MIPAGGGEGGSSSANLADLPVIGFSQVANMLEEKLFFGHVGVSNQLDGHGNQVGPEKGGGRADRGVRLGGWVAVLFYFFASSAELHREAKIEN